MLRHPNITFNFPDTTKFLSILQPNDEIFVFTSFDDDKVRKDPNLVSQLIGTFEEHKDKLIELNRNGAGIYVTINKTDRTGRKKRNITGIQSIWIEADEGIPPDLPIVPSMIITSSPGKYHYYFLTKEDTPPEVDFSGVMHTIVEKYKSDPNAKDISRVLRLPGFAHLKAQEFLVDLTTDNNVRYTWQEIEAAFPPSQKDKRYTAEFIDSRGTGYIPKTSQIVNMLSYINPEQPRYEWLNNLMSLHHEYLGSDEGLDVAIKWSRGEFTESKKVPDNYDGDDSVRITWDSLAYGRAGSRTLGSIHHEASAKGWRPDEYTTHAIKFIETEQNAVLEKVNKTYAIVNMPGGGVKITRRNPDTGKYVMEGKNDMALALSGIKVAKLDPKTNQVKRIDAAILWIESNNKLRFNNQTFRPLAKKYNNRRSIIEADPQLPPGTLNTYLGMNIAPATVPDQSLIDLTKYLILNVICSGDQESADHFTKWIAHIRQYPDIKTELMITLMGRKGTGKSVMAEIIMDILGPHVYETASFTDILGQFNDHLTDTILCFLDEATWGGDQRDNSNLKNKITTKKMARNKKYESSDSDAANYTNYFATANPGYAVPEDLRDEERRFWTITISDLHRKDKTFFAQFGTRGSRLRTKILESFAHYLDTIDLAFYDPQSIPAIVGKDSRRNIIDTSGGAMKFLIHSIENDILVPPKEGTIVIDLETDSINQMWNAPVDPKDPHSEFVLVKVSTIKTLYQEFAKSIRTQAIDSVRILDELEKFTKVEKRQSPTVQQVTQYSHLDRGGKYVKMWNRSRLIKHFVEDLQVLSKDEYHGEYPLFLPVQPPMITEEDKEKLKKRKEFHKKTS